ncbi:MAG: NAD(P)-dependent oxidoreductase [Xanthomonadales bacterium]|nr:NAD(P)-dependent oxidoreductase [Xanthomonadales bacterium]
MSTGSNNLSGKTLFITGASRGIGKAIALRAARDGANIVVASKTDQPHPRLEGTIHTAVAEINAAGGHGLAIGMDVREDDQVDAAIDKAVTHFGGIDILVNNASAIMLKGTQELPMRRFDLMFEANVRGSYTAIRAAIPHLLKAANPHVLNLSPPLNLNPDWFAPHVAYTMSKYGMSMCVLGMAEEFRKQGVAFNTLWPRTVIATAALSQLGDMVSPDNCRTPEIMADSAHEILCRDSRSCTGNFFLDENVLRSAGMKSFDQYSVKAGMPLMKDLFLD